VPQLGRDSSSLHDLSPLSVRIAAQPDQNAPYPTGATPITGNAAGTTGAVAARWRRPPAS
jgi:hypothetical protein